MTAVAGQRFPHSMRLKRKRLSAALFTRSGFETRSIAVGSIRLLFRCVNRIEIGVETPVQVGFAPGRCANAVQRNRLKRKMREIWRIHQHLVSNHTLDPSKTLTIMVVVRDQTRLEEIPHDLLQAMHLLHQTLNKGD